MSQFRDIFLKESEMYKLLSSGNSAPGSGGGSSGNGGSGGGGGRGGSGSGSGQSGTRGK